MNHFLIIFLLSISLNSIGQTCDTINGVVLNCIDSNGLRQGNWELTKKKVLLSSDGSYGNAGSGEGRGYFEKAEYYPLENGQYRDNKKVGTWEYYSGDKSVKLIKKITYYDNGSIREENLPDPYVININNDTSVISGNIYNNLDTLLIDCQSNNCSIRLSNKQQLTSFEFDNLNDLRFELLRLQIGEYDHEIRRIKNVR